MVGVTGASEVSKVKATANAYAAVTEAVERGVAFGWRRAFKHSDDPSEEFARDTIVREVMVALDDVVAFT